MHGRTGKNTTTTNGVNADASGKRGEGEKKK